LSIKITLSKVLDELDSYCSCIIGQRHVLYSRRDDNVSEHLWIEYENAPL